MLPTTESFHHQANQLSEGVSGRTYRYETTADGDVVITDPSFEDVVEQAEDPSVVVKKTGSSTWQKQSPGIRSGCLVQTSQSPSLTQLVSSLLRRHKIECR